MANREVNLTKRVQTTQGLAVLPCRAICQRPVKPDVVIVDGHEERHPEGAYYLEWHEGAKRAGSPWARMPRTPTRAACEKKPN